MPLNIPEYTANNIGFGPGRLFLGAAGATPTIDVGAITEDGITITPDNQLRHIRQGNPKLIIESFSQQQDLTVEVGSIEWNFDNLSRALGAGNTTSSGSEDTFAYGGDPLVKKVALMVEHQMAVSGHTLNAYIWQAVSNGAPTMPFTHDEHTFTMSWTAQRVTTDWAGNALASTEQLIKIVRTK